MTWCTHSVPELTEFLSLPFDWRTFLSLSEDQTTSKRCLPSFSSACIMRNESEKNKNNKSRMRESFFFVRSKKKEGNRLTFPLYLVPALQHALPHGSHVSACPGPWSSGEVLRAFSWSKMRIIIARMFIVFHERLWDSKLLTSNADPSSVWQPDSFGFSCPSIDHKSWKFDQTPTDGTLHYGQSPPDTFSMQYTGFCSRMVRLTRIIEQTVQQKHSAHRMSDCRQQLTLFHSRDLIRS